MCVCCLHVRNTYATRAQLTQMATAESLSLLGGPPDPSLQVTHARAHTHAHSHTHRYSPLAAGRLGPGARPASGTAALAVMGRTQLRVNMGVVFETENRAGVGGARSVHRCVGRGVGADAAAAVFQRRRLAARSARVAGAALSRANGEGQPRPREPNKVIKKVATTSKPGRRGQARAPSGQTRVLTSVSPIYSLFSKQPNFARVSQLIPRNVAHCSSLASATSLLSQLPGHQTGAYYYWCFKQ